MSNIDSRASAQKPPVDELRRDLCYSPETGEFVRLATHRQNGYGVGRVVGVRDDQGYLRVWLQGRTYKAHRLAWLHMTGDWPDGSIDHINGDKQDNRWCNLRVVDHKTNLENQRRARSDNTAGLLGATWHKATGRWRARIITQGRQKHLGLFETVQEAHDCYLNAKRAMHAGCTI